MLPDLGVSRRSFGGTGRAQPGQRSQGLFVAASVNRSRSLLSCSPSSSVSSVENQFSCCFTCIAAARLTKGVRLSMKTIDGECSRAAAYQPRGQF